MTDVLASKGKGPAGTPAKSHGGKARTSNADLELGGHGAAGEHEAKSTHRGTMV